MVDQGSGKGMLPAADAAGTDTGVSHGVNYWEEHLYVQADKTQLY
jgi:hypothetical protein